MPRAETGNALTIMGFSALGRMAESDYSGSGPTGSFFIFLWWVFLPDVCLQLPSNHKVPCNDEHQPDNKNRLVLIHHPVADSQNSKNANAQDEKLVFHAGVFLRNPLNLLWK